MPAASPSPHSSLFQLYRQTLKREDIFFNIYVCRPLAAVFVQLLLPTRITPNQVTLFSLGLALGASGWLAIASWPLGLWGGLALFELSYIFDKVDGMLARARGQASVSGQLLDFLMDEIKALVLLAAAGWGAYQQSLQVEYLLAAMAGIVALAGGLSITTFQRRPEIAASGNRTTQSNSRSDAGLLVRAVRAAEQIGKWGIHYPTYLWLAAVFTDIRIYLVPYVAVNIAYFIRSLLGLVWRYGRLG